MMCEAINYMTKERYYQEIAEAAAVFQRTKGRGSLGDADNEMLKRFAQDKWPTRKSEDFRYSRLMDLLEKNISYKAPTQVSCTVRAAESMTHLQEKSHFFHFSPGQALKKHFQSAADERQITWQTLQEAQRQPSPHILNIPDTKERFFPSINTLFLGEGSVLSIPDGVVLERPLYFFYETNCSPTHTRHLIHLGKGSQASIIAYHTSPRTQTPLHENALYEIVCESGSHLQYCKVQNDEAPMLRVDNTLITQAKDSSLQLNTFTFNTWHTRNQVYLQSKGSNTRSQLGGLYILRGKAQAHNHLCIEHQQPHTSSQQCYKGVLRDEAQSVFEGRIHIFPHAQKTEAYQKNNNILLDDTAASYSKPQLEIYADDVRCSHGCTSNFLDNAMIFYMQSRGIKKKTAQYILLGVFANEVLQGIANKALKSDLHALITHQIQHHDH